MVVLTITATSNPCTVYFDRPIPQANYVSLLTCSLPNSWHTLKKKGQISLFDADEKESTPFTVLEGHYTLEEIARAIEDVFLKSYCVKMLTEINTPTGVMTIQNTTGRRVCINVDLARFLGGIDHDLKPNKTVVERVEIPSTYFVYCDLLDPEHNLVNGKRSQLLASFYIRGKPFEKVCYQNDDIYSFRDASTGENFNSVTLSVKDENGELFDFFGQKLFFTLLIN